MNSQASERRRIRKLRRELSPRQRKALSRKMCTRLRKLPEFNHSRSIAAYIPFGGEIDPSLLIKNPALSSKRFFHPIIDRMGHRMFFVPAKERVRKNRFGIHEPLFSNGSQHFARKLDLVLMPLVAFDKNGHRIGAGGGYYDHCFQHRTGFHHKPVLVGIGYDFQELPSITPNPWDVKLDAVVTPTRTLFF